MSNRNKAAQLVDLTREQPEQSGPPELIDISDDDSDLICVDHVNSNHDNRSHPTATSASTTNDSKRKQPCRTPLTPEQLLGTKRLKSSQFVPPDTPENTLKCPICIETYKTIKTRGIKVVVTRCGHLFCDSCLKKAFVENGRKCPKCRRNVPKSAASVIEVFDVC